MNHPNTIPRQRAPQEAPTVPKNQGWKIAKWGAALAIFGTCLQQVSEIPNAKPESRAVNLLPFDGQAPASAAPTAANKAPQVTKSTTTVTPHETSKPKPKTKVVITPKKAPAMQKVAKTLGYPLDGNAPGTNRPSVIWTCYSASHRGLDEGQAWGAPVYASADGYIVMDQPADGYGAHYEVIDHGFVMTGYGHMTTSYGKVGEFVKRHQLIGRVGQEGEASTPHVHENFIAEGTPKALWFNSNESPQTAGLTSVQGVADPYNCL